MTEKDQSGGSDTKLSGSHHYVGFWGKLCMILGLCQVVIGVSSMVVNGVGIYFHAHMHNYAQGMWSGAIFFISGFCGVLAGHLKTPIPVKVTFILSILSGVLTIPMLGITAAGLDHDRRQGFNYWVKDPYTGIDYLDGKNDTREAAHAILLTLSLLELILAVLSTLICIHGIFYCSTYKGASQSPGQAILFPKSSSPVSHDVPMVAASEKPKDVPGPNVNYQQTATANPAASPEYSQPDTKPVTTYPSQPGWKPSTNNRQSEGGPPILIGATGSSAFQPLHTVHAASKPTSHGGSHNTSSSSFTPLHMIQPEHPYVPPGRHNISASSSEMYPPPKKTSSRSSTPAGGYYGNQSHDHSGAIGYSGGQQPSSRSSKSPSAYGGSSPAYHSGGHHPGGHQMGGGKHQRRI